MNIFIVESENDWQEKSHEILGVFLSYGAAWSFLTSQLPDIEPGNPLDQVNIWTIEKGNPYTYTISRFTVD